jgi:glutamate-ammonia-ligase adenylyltransferase
MDRMEFPPEPMRERIQPLIEAVAAGSTPPDLEERLRIAGVPANASTAGHFIRICRELGGGPGGEEKLAMILASLLESAHPTGALVNFLRYIDTVGVSGTFLNTLAEAVPLRDVLAAIFGGSQYMSDIIIRNPGYLYWLMEKDTWDEDDTAWTFEEALRGDVERFSTVDGKLNAARRFQRRMLLKIGVKDLLGIQEVESTAAKLSDLAEAIVSVVLEILWRDLSKSSPGAAATPGVDQSMSGARPSPPEFAPGPGASGSGFCVLALGKLGGRELNYSSDIDLIYICRDADDAWFEFYHKLGTRLTEALSSMTGEGYLYRTDLRLRPDGVSGPLVNSLTALRIYYEGRGRPWEFQAMLKARVIAGDRCVGGEFMTYVSGLLLNPSTIESPVEEIASMRKRIRENISDREKILNIKLMEGGIRDIEFIVQTLQLLHGSQAPSIRAANTLEGIRRAHAQNLVSRSEVEAMTRAYVFFRLVEHRLQMMHQLKMHSLPESPGEIEILARRVSQGPLGRFTHDSFLSTLALHLNKIRELGESFFSGRGMPDAAALTLLPEDEGAAADLLRRHRFADPKRALSVFHTLAYGSFPHLVDRTTRTAFQRLLPDLVDDCATTGDPDLTLLTFARLCEAMKSEGGFYGLLSEVPSVRLIVRNLAGASSVLAAKLSRHPDLIDLLLEDPEFTLVAPLPQLSSLERFAEGSSGTAAADLQRDLGAFFDRRILAAWVIDDRARSFPRTISESLTSTVREMISAVLERLIGDETGAALLALGSFGVGEPRIGSDADLLVVTEGRDIEEVTRCVHALHRVFSDAGILKIDFRLRGEGANAPLVQDLDYYRHYVRTRMEPWEHVAFAKCAHWWGDGAVSKALVSTLLEAIATPLTAQRLRALIETRRRLESLAPKGAELFETKRSAGGRYDIEYLNAIALARSGLAFHPSADTVTRLGLLAANGVITKEEHAMLGESFQLFRNVDFLLELQGFSLPRSPEKERTISSYLDRTFDLLGLRAEGGVEKSLAESKRAVRACYDRLAGE